MEGKKQQISESSGVLSHAPLFIAAAHELKAPLALVRQLSLSLEEGNSSTAELTRIARQITLTSERALRLTTDLTRTARLDDGLFALEPINPISLCQQVADELRPLYVAKGRKITVAGYTRPILGLANRDLLRRILLNFADNALHYSDGAPVVLTASSYNGGSRIRLGVRDYGPAVPANLQSRLARGLGTCAQPLHSRPESSGLGLYIARQFAEAMHATIGTTRHRDGATFYVDIGASTQLRLL